MDANVARSAVTEDQSLASDWNDVINQNEALSSLSLDRRLIHRAQLWHTEYKLSDTLNFHIPSIKTYHSEQIASCGANLWPAISLTGGHCSLMCDHCQANVLKAMVPATSAKHLWRLGQDAALRGARGMLLSGGSNHRNEVNFSPYLETIHRLKASFPHLIIACHTGLLDDDQAMSLQHAGIDCAMIDIIGSQDTITQVYHLRRSVDDFEDSLCALNKTSMFVIPHIVLGLHYGKLLGEWQALDIIKQQRPDALVLVVAMPHFATGKRSYELLDSQLVGQLFVDARQTLKQLPLLLGCARPAGKAKLEIDSYAVCAGLDGIAYPGEGIVDLATAIGKSFDVHYSCCSVVPDMIEKTRLTTS